MVRTPSELRATYFGKHVNLYNPRDEVTYVTQRGVVSISDDGLKIPEDFSFSEDGAVLPIQYIEPVLAGGKLLGDIDVEIRKTHRTDRAEERQCASI